MLPARARSRPRRVELPRSVRPGGAIVCRPSRREEHLMGEGVAGPGSCVLHRSRGAAEGRKRWAARSVVGRRLVEDPARKGFHDVPHSFCKAKQRSLALWPFTANYA
jgi:hypothetical protein